MIGTQPAPEAARRAGPGALLLIALLALTLVGFTITRAARVQDDVVNSVRLSERLEPGETATVAFNTTLADERADVLITDTEDRQVRALELGIVLPAGAHRYSWDGTGDDGEPVAPGAYGLRVILGERGRDVKPPGRIEVLPSGAAPDG